MRRIEGPDPEQIALDYTATDLPADMKAILAFALKLNDDPIGSIRRNWISF